MAQETWFPDNWYCSECESPLAIEDNNERDLPIRVFCTCIYCNNHDGEYMSEIHDPSFLKIIFDDYEEDDY